MKKIMLISILALVSTVACFESPTNESKTTTEVVTLGVVALAMTSSRSLILQGRCDLSGSGACVEYATGWSTSQMTADCSSVSGTFTSGNVSCSITSRVGSCALTNRGIGTTVTGTTGIFRFYSSNYTQSTAQTYCNAVNGVFTAN
jgi:hypothetical protein